MVEPVLSVRALEVTFVGSGRPAPAVRGVSFDVYPNEVLGIVGESGSGKSVTALTVAGLAPDTARIEGTVILGGVDVTRADAETLRRLRGQGVGVIFQDPTTTLNPVLPIGRQVIEGQVAHGRIAPAQSRARAAELLRQVDIPDPANRIDQYPHQFSGGMRQRAVIAMAMAGEPQLIIADEPTTALDVTVQAQVLSVLAKRQQQTGAAVILITHDLGVVAEMADRIAVMYGGRIVETGTVDDIFKRPRHPYTIALLQSAPRIDGEEERLDPIPGQPPLPTRLPSGCSFHPRCAIGRDRPRCAGEDPQLRALSASQSAACHFLEDTGLRASVRRARAEAAIKPAIAPVSDEPLLSVDKLKVHFPIKAGLLRRRVGVVRAVNDVSLNLRAGETLGLVGESGCGKTTTGRAIMGLIKPTAGDIRFDGRSVVGLGGAALRDVRRHMQYVFQDPYSSLNPVLAVADIIAEPLRIHGLYEQMGGAKRIGELLELVGLSRAMAGRYPREFSGGQKQRIGIARALALQPKLLILDEPVAALDVSIQAQIVNLLRDLQQELNLAYLFIAHDLSVVRHISDRVAVMYLGRIVEESSKSALYETPTHPYTQSLMSAAPTPDPDARRSHHRIVLEGEIPNPASPPSGCAFHPRCFRASAICASTSPAFTPFPGLPTRTACHHAGPLDAVTRSAARSAAPLGVTP